MTWNSTPIILKPDLRLSERLPGGIKSGEVWKWWVSFFSGYPLQLPLWLWGPSCPISLHTFPPLHPYLPTPCSALFLQAWSGGWNFNCFPKDPWGQLQAKEPFYTSICSLSPHPFLVLIQISKIEFAKGKGPQDTGWQLVRSALAVCYILHFNVGGLVPRFMACLLHKSLQVIENSIIFTFQKSKVSLQVAHQDLQYLGQN